jgi:predicted PurR-regulated permease PerM
VESLPRLEFGPLWNWIKDEHENIARRAWEFVKKSVGGFLGMFGFFLGFFLVPLYLFFFLREATNIRDQWTDYIPLKASKFKDEVVGTLTEINGYLIAFFRGQMLVSLIDGAITALLLTAMGLKFGLLIGLLVGILGIIPYLGIIACFVPAVIIATVQGGKGDWELFYLFPMHAPWWVLPVLVTAVFIAVNNLDGIFIAPKIVGDSVGLHPFTVIVSVLFWSFLLGGLLGAILAVPLTASVKVLFRRYIWMKRILPQMPGGEEGGGGADETDAPGDGDGDATPRGSGPPSPA